MLAGTYARKGENSYKLFFQITLKICVTSNAIRMSHIALRVPHIFI